MVSDMMTAEKVRLSILQQAIQGKLTKQCHNENAIDHLKRIHAYNKSIQEQDFEIPDNWAWAKLADLTTDDSLNDGNWILSKDMSTVGTINLIQLGSVGDCVFKPKDYKRITEKKFDELQCREIYPGYLLINRLIGDRLLSCILPQIEGRLITAVDVCWVAPQPRMYNLKYIMYMCASPFFQSQVKALGHGTTRFRISKTNLINIAFPYPPIEEQARIVDLFESVEPYLVKCEEAERHLVLLNASFPEMMKKSILQEAVQGKLVPQDPNDEPASLLLKKIAEEKKRLIKEGKIKKQKPLPEITEDEIPFDIPESWEWVRFENAVDMLSGFAFKSSDFVQDGEYRLLRGINLGVGEVRWDDTVYVNNIPDKLSTYQLKKGDVLLGLDRPWISNGIRVAVFDGLENTYLVQRVLRIREIGVLSCEYVALILRSSLLSAAVQGQTTGISVPHISPKQIGSIAVPVPPVEEQKRIVEKVKLLCAEVDSLRQ